MTRCAVLGKPIAHSLSPSMHRRAYAELGLTDWTYDACEVDEAGLKSFVDGLDASWAGLSLTMPLKRAAMALADEVSPVAKALGVANTLQISDGRLLASNTDCTGAGAALAERGIHNLGSVRILGGGATAASIVYALTSTAQISVEFVVRDAGRAAEAIGVAKDAGADVTVRPFDAPMLDVVDLLVSTVPAGSVRRDAHDLVDSARAVFDVVYDPWPTPLLSSAREKNIRFVSGLDLLAHQAALQVLLMTGQAVEPALLRQAALDELARR